MVQMELAILFNNNFRMERLHCEKNLTYILRFDKCGRTLLHNLADWLERALNAAILGRSIATGLDPIGADYHTPAGPSAAMTRA